MVPPHQQHTRYSCKETSWSSQSVHPHALGEVVASRLLDPEGLVSCTNMDPAGLYQALGSGNVEVLLVSLFLALPATSEHIADAGFHSEPSWLLQR